MGKNKKNKKFGSTFRSNPMSRTSLGDQMVSERFVTPNSDDEMPNDFEDVSTDPEVSWRKLEVLLIKSLMHGSHRSVFTF